MNLTWSGSGKTQELEALPVVTVSCIVQGARVTALYLKNIETVYAALMPVSIGTGPTSALLEGFSRLDPEGLENLRKRAEAGEC
jgi:hypothetical protein